MTREFGFEAAHFLEGHRGKCAGMHGHSYRLEITVRGALDPNGMVIDFDDLSAIVDDRVIAVFDHTLLNEVIPTPTAENIAVEVWDRLVKPIAGLTSVVVHETRRNKAAVRLA